MSQDGHGARPEDLSALSRRGALTSQEERELEHALAASATLRAAHALGADLDRETAVRAGDEERILAAADAALARVTARAKHGAASRSEDARSAVDPRRRRRRVLAALIAAALVSASGMAGAWWTGVAPVPAFVREVLPVVIASRLPPRRVTAVHAKVATVAANTIAAPVLAPPGAPIAAAPRDESATAATANVPPTINKSSEKHASAAELFTRANSARRSGELTRAEHLYSELIAKFPSSDEARLAEVSLGKLLLASGDPARAERQFRRYLSGSGAPLAEEALVSQAESLHAMNRPNEERKSWQRLLAEHPGSVYAARARARLEALGR